MWTVSTWHCAAIPCRDTTTDLRHVCTSSSSVCRNADSGRPFDPSFNTWRPSVSCGCRTRLELSAVLAASSPVTDDVQAPPESRTVRVLLHLGLTVLLHYQHACFSTVPSQQLLLSHVTLIMLPFNNNNNNNNNTLAGSRGHSRDWSRTCSWSGSRQKDSQIRLSQSTVCFSAGVSWKPRPIQLFNIGLSERPRSQNLSYFIFQRFCSSFKESRSRFNVLTPCFCMIPSQSTDRTTSHSAGCYLLFLTIGIFTTKGN